MKARQCFEGVQTIHQDCFLQAGQGVKWKTLKAKQKIPLAKSDWGLTASKMPF